MTRRPLFAAALAVASFAALPRSSPAQVSVGATVLPAFESLSPEGSAKESRGTIDGGLDGEALFASERGRAFYTLDAGTFATPGDWSFVQHDAGLTWRLGDTSATHAFLGVSLDPAPQRRRVGRRRPRRRRSEGQPRLRWDGRPGSRSSTPGGPSSAPSRRSSSPHPPSSSRTGSTTTPTRATRPRCAAC